MEGSRRIELRIKDETNKRERTTRKSSKERIRLR
jgi:hypothetical protein